MSQIETTTATERYREHCEDRVAVLNGKDRTVVVVADGAGGIGSGGFAAESVIREITSEYQSIHSANEWACLLQRIDSRISKGESTAVVVDIRSVGIAGASVGDSRAWIVDSDQCVDLTACQNRKPLLGSGLANPVGFTHAPLDGRLLVATDGLYDYAKRDDLIGIVYQSDYYEVTQKCIDLVRLPSGDLWDDVGIVVARNKPQPRTRLVYEI